MKENAMPTHGSVAANVRRDKEANPQNYCPVPRCLWRSGGLHCPNHTVGGPKHGQ